MLEPDAFVQAVTFDFRGRRACLAYLARDEGPDVVWVDGGTLVVAKDANELASRVLSGGAAIKAETGTVFTEDEVHIDIEVPQLPAGPLDSATAELLWNGWSLLDDMAYSIGRPLDFHGRDADQTLEKLFHGMNIFNVDREYQPTFTRDERRKFHQMVAAGQDRLAAALPDGWLARSAG